MKQVLRISSVLAAGIGTTAAIWLSNKPNRMKAKNVLNKWKKKVNPDGSTIKDRFPIEKGGNPEPDNIEDNNMVSEGGIYSVKFYNEKMQ
ncbi:hypothetical protein [Bacillus sp. B15-48]|uniref:hypothetical protein n=1 Tax=Bacillus sp. B15-48 TaxID=1548601 RepID=UPI00193F42C1|nr:hypothetical protein [Bacillus sp. B15-48]MBM4763065.1 hypothetical protein [Bacillus sp. B15-48]